MSKSAKLVVSVVLASAFLCPAIGISAVRGREIMYVGGTIASIPEKTEGSIELSDQSMFIFTAKAGKFVIPYKGITSIEYGQKAGRRVGVALAVSPIALFSKKRRHYVSIAFKDNSGIKQGAVFECAKGIVHSVVLDLEKRSGTKVEFESEEAKKHFEKEAK